MATHLVASIFCGQRPFLLAILYWNTTPLPRTNLIVLQTSPPVRLVLSSLERTIGHAFADQHLLWTKTGFVGHLMPEHHSAASDQFDWPNNFTAGISDAFVIGVNKWPCIFQPASSVDKDPFCWPIYTGTPFRCLFTAGTFRAFCIGPNRWPCIFLTSIFCGQRPFL